MDNCIVNTPVSVLLNVFVYSVIKGFIKLLVEGQTISYILIAVGAVGLEAHCILGTAAERKSSSLSFSQTVQT